MTDTAITLSMTQLRAIAEVVTALEVLDAHGTVFETAIHAYVGDTLVSIDCDESCNEFTVTLRTPPAEVEAQHAAEVDKNSPVAFMSGGPVASA